MLATMGGAATSNVLIFLAAMFAFMTVWVGLAAVGGSNALYGVLAVLLGVATVITFRAYRRLLRKLDAQERQG